MQLVGSTSLPDACLLRGTISSYIIQLNFYLYILGRISHNAEMYAILCVALTVKEKICLFWRFHEILAKRQWDSNCKSCNFLYWCEHCAWYANITWTFRATPSMWGGWVYWKDSKHNCFNTARFNRLLEGGKFCCRKHPVCIRESLHLDRPRWRRVLAIPLLLSAASGIWHCGWKITRLEVLKKEGGPLYPCTVGNTCSFMMPKITDR